MQTNLAEDCSFRTEDIVNRIRNGEEHLRDYLLKSNWGFIMSSVTRMTGKPASVSDEFSVALQAFNEAIDCYDPNKNASFISFSGLVMNRRVIDYIRKSKKFGSEYPYTYFDSEDEENRIEKITSNKSDFTEKIEIQEEIMRFKNNLSDYGITFEDLVKLSPKHKDTRKLCVSVSKMLVSNLVLSQRLERDKKLPIAEIVEHFGLSRKTVENHRKYIIALYLVLSSDMEIIKGYVNLLAKGVQ